MKYNDDSGSFQFVRRDRLVRHNATTLPEGLPDLLGFSTLAPDVLHIKKL
jgi:hypothetical protein